jgi:hypothetical protein
MIFWWSSNSQHGAWAAASIIALVLGIVLSVFFGASSPLLRLLLLSLPALLLILALIVTLTRGNKQQAQSETAPSEKEKPKRGESLGELMSILNDEDIDDLRARVKARLEEQIDTADASEMETFEDLLDETKRKRR